MGALADMIRAGVDPDLIERVVMELSGKPRAMTAAERQAKRRATVKASRENVTSDAEIGGQTSHESHEKRDEHKKEDPQTPKEKTTPSDTSCPQDAGKPSSMDENPKEILFEGARRWLEQVSGKTERQLRRLIGLWLRDIGGDAHAAQLLGILRDAKTQGKADPIAWIQAMVRARGGGARAGPSSDGVASFMRKLHEENNGSGDFESEPLREARLAAVGAGGGSTAFENRDRDRPERPYLDLVAVGAK